MSDLTILTSAALVALTLLGCGPSATPSGSAAMTCEPQAAAGVFILTRWADIEGNSFRVNGPDVAEGRFKDRWEAKQTGLLEMDLPELAPEGLLGAAVYLELWGGHPGVRGKRFSVNGSADYGLPEVGAAEHHCVYSYPRVAIDPALLCGGLNRLQFACDAGNTFWAHYLVRQAAVEYELAAGHPLVAAAGLEGLNASDPMTVRAEPVVDARGEALRLSLDCDAALAARIESVVFQGYYTGYDENGDGAWTDWHGFTRDRRPIAFAAVAADGSLAADWDLTMLPDQTAPMAVRARVSFRDAGGLSYQTAPLAVAMPERAARVTLYAAERMDRPFWSRAGNAKFAEIRLPADLADRTIEAARLHVAIWDGGDGGRADHFTLNGRRLAIADEGLHEVRYRRIDLPREMLISGINLLRLLSDTTHHGIEGLRPGPAIVVREIGR